MTIFGITVFEYICNIIFYLEFCVFLHSVLTPRIKTKWMILSYLLLTNGILLASFLFAKMSVARILLLPTILMIFNCAMYKDKRLRCIFLAWLVMAIMYVTELIILAVVYPPEMLVGRIGDASMINQVFYWTLEIGGGAVLYWVVSLVMNRVRNRFTVREMLMYSFFPVSQCMLIYGWLNATRLSGGERHQLLVIVVMILCIAADAGLFTSMLRVSRRAELEMENRLLEAQVSMQQSHYRELSAQHENIRRMQEEVDGHIRAMNELLASGRHSEAAAYVTELRATSYDRTLGICQHPVVDAYLHNAAQRAGEEGLLLDIKASVPADISIADTDLVCTFGNLLDNAFEACAGRAGAVIHLRAHTAAGYLLISTENPIGDAGEKKQRIQGLERGIGLRVLEGLAEKYSGSLRYGAEDDSFRTEITYKL